MGGLQTPEARAIAQASHAEAHVGEDLESSWRNSQGIFPKFLEGVFAATFPWNSDAKSMEKLPFYREQFIMKDP